MNGAAHDMERQHRPSLAVALLCAWMLMFVTFSFPGTGGATKPDELGAVAQAKLLVRLVALLLLAGLIWRHRYSDRLRDVRYMLWPWLALGAWALLSVSWSPLKAVSLGQAASLLALLLLSASTALCWRSRRDTSRVVFHLCCALLVASGLLLVVAVGFPASMCMTRDGEGLFHATNTASTSAVGLLLLLAARLVWRWNWSHAMFWPGLAMHSAVLLLSTNRVALAMVLLLAVVIAVGYTQRGLVAASTLGGCLALAVYLAFDPAIRIVGGALDDVAHYAKRGQTLDQLGALSGREEMWEKIWRSYFDSPWIGHGYFVSSKTGQLYVWYEWSNWTAHNVWLQILVSTGLVGLALLLLALCRTGWLFARAWAEGIFDRKLAVVLALMTTYYSVWSLFNESIAGPIMPESVVFFALLGLGTGTACRGWARRQASALLSAATTVGADRFRRPAHLQPPRTEEPHRVRDLVVR